MQYSRIPARFVPLPMVALLLSIAGGAQALALGPGAPPGPTNGLVLCAFNNANGNTIAANCVGNSYWTAGNITVNPGVTVSDLGAVLQFGAASETPLNWVNNGTMIGTNNGAAAISALEMESRGLYNFVNNGTFNGHATLANDSATIDLLQNSGLWSSMSFSYSPISNYSNGVINTLTNTGTIEGARFTVIENYGTINTLNNEGLMLANQGEGIAIINETMRGLVNAPVARIVTLNNLQGGDTQLTFRGTLPENYNVIIRSPSQYGKLVVMQPSTERISATGPTQAVSALYGTMRFGVAQGSTVTSTTYTDVLSGLSAADLGNALTGTYNGFRWTLSDTDNNQVWDLILSLNAVATSAVAPRSPVASGAAAVIDANSALLDLFGNVQGDATTLNTAVTQTLPFLAGGSTTLTQGAMGRINQVIQGRFDANRGASAGNSYFGNGSVWFKPFGGKAIQGDVGGTPGYKANLYGLSGGVEGDASATTRLGVAYAYAQNDMGGRGATNPQSGQATIHQLIGYGLYQLDERTSLDFQADVGSNRNTTRRFMAFAGATATASYDSSTAHLGLGVQRSYSLADGLKVSPFARIDYTRVKDDAYTESGAGLLNLNVAAKRTESYVSTLGASLQRALNERSSLVARAGIGYDHSHGKGVLTAAYAGAPTASFTTSGALPAPWLATLGLGLSWRTVGGPELLTQYDLELREKFTNQTVSFKLRWAF